MKTIAFASASTLCLGLSAGMWLRGSPVADPILRTRGIEVVDAKGTTRMRIGENPRNHLPGFYLYSDTGELLGEFGVEDGKAPFLLFRSKSGQWMAQFTTDGVGSSSWQFYSEDKTRAAIGVGIPFSTEGEPAKQAGYMFALDKDGKVVHGR